MFVKYFFPLLTGCMLVSGTMFSQIFTVGSTGMSVQAGTTLFVDSLVLTPSANVTLTSTALTQSSTAMSVNGNSSINNVFTFSSPIVYSGSVALGYSATGLNGNLASALIVGYDSATGGTYTLNCGSTVDTTNDKVTSAAISGATLYNITAVQSSISVDAITGATGLNIGTTTAFSDSTSGGTWSSYNTALATISSAGVVSGITGGTDTIAYTVSNTCNSATAIKVINAYSNTTWTGTTSNDWGTGSNWSTGITPTEQVSATVPSGTPNNPQLLTASYSAKNLSLSSGATITINSGDTLNIKGNLTNNGNIPGSGSLSLNSSAAQTISGTGSVDNMELNNAAGATVSTGALLSINDALTVTSGTLTTNDSLVLGSDSAATARIAPIPSTGSAIIGNVKVMQFVEGGYRRFRFWSTPFSTAIPLSQIENYIDVTGTLGATNGFTSTGTNAPSAFRYTPLSGNSYLAYDPGWKPFTSAYGTADSNKINQFQGIRLFIRGSKGEGLNGWTYTPSSATIGMWGPVNQGSQVVYLEKGTADSGQDYNQVGNPYPSPVDIGTVIYNAKVAGNITGSGFYIWNPELGAGGQFQVIPIGTTSASPYYLQGNCAFQVRAAHNGDSLNFSENNKSATASASLMRVLPEYVTLAVYDSSYHPWDMLYLKFNDAAKDAEDDHDAAKPAGADFNFYSISADNHRLGLDARPYRNDEIIPLGVTSAYQQDFIIKAESIALPAGAKLYLHDKLLQQYTQLQQGAEYHFTITKDEATQGNNRFELGMEPSSIAQALPVPGLKVSMTPNPATNEVNIQFNQATKEKVIVRVTDVSGITVYIKNLGMQQDGTVSIPVSQFASGIYMVELTSGTQKVVQRLMKE